MDKEIGDGTSLAVVLIALAAVISLAFTIFSIAKNNANEGSVDVQQQLDTVSKSVFDTYDQKVVTGTQVTSAVKSFKGETVAILIATNSMQGSTPRYKEHTECYLISVEGDDIDPDTGENWLYYNYGAVVAADADGTRPTSGTETACLRFDSELGKYIAYGWATKDNGVILTDTQTGGQTRSGNCEFIPSSAKFNAYLLTDETGESIMGIVFRQVPKG